MIIIQKLCKLSRVMFSFGVSVGVSLNQIYPLTKFLTNSNYNYSDLSINFAKTAFLRFSEIAMCSKILILSLFVVILNIYFPIFLYIKKIMA